MKMNKKNNNKIMNKYQLKNCYNLINQFIKKEIKLYQ